MAVAQRFWHAVPLAKAQARDVVYTHLFMPIGLWFQRPLRFGRGMIPSAEVDDILLVCRRIG